MSTITNATPRAIFPGFDDQSGRAVPAEVEATPQHAPFFYAVTQTGPVEPLYVTGPALSKIYGDKTFDVRGKFYNPITHSIETTFGAGNAGAYVKRLIPTDASTSKIVLAVEIVDEEVPVYERDDDNKIVRDENGDRVATADAPIDGYRVRIVAMPVTPSTQIDSVAIGDPGTLTGKAGSTSTIYPIMGLETMYGAAYNNMGIRLSSPVTGGNSVNQDVIADQDAMLYRAELIEKSVTGKLVNKSTLFAEKTIEFALAENIFDRATNLDLNAERIVTAYQNVDTTTGRLPQYGPFSSIHVYYDNLNTVLSQIFPVENAYSHLTLESQNLINILMGIAYDDTEHYAFIMDDSSIIFDGSTTLYPTGGADGDVTWANVEDMIIDEMNYNWENPDYPLMDTRKYQFSDLYDAGFKMDTKKALVKALGYRPDVKVCLSTQDVSAAQNTMAEESSLAAVLDAECALYPESSVNGTSVCRATIIGHSGYKPNDKFKGLLTFTDQIVEIRSLFQGAGDGKMKPNKAYDRSPLNRISGWSGVNCPWKPDAVRENDWKAGLNYVQWYDRNTLFRSALQTVYKDDTSILNSSIVTDIMVDVTKQCDIVWSEFTGRSDLTDGQFVSECETRFNELVEGRYAGRVVIVPTCYYTPADEARGYSWTMDVAVYGNNMKTVGTFNVIARRQSDLA